MAMRVSGMISGMNTDDIVKQMMSGYTARKDKIWKTQKSLEYKQDAWKDMNKEIYEFFSNTLSNARMSSSYQTKELALSNSNIASVSAKDITGTSTLKIDKVASQSFLTGSVVDQTHVIGVSGKFTVKIGGEEKEINLTADMSMKQVANKLKDVGLNANFDEKNRRLFLSSKSTGLRSNFEIAGGDKILSAIGLGVSSNYKKGEDAVIKFNGAQFTSENNNFNINGTIITALTEGITTISSKNNNHIFEGVKDFIEKYNSLITKIDGAYNSAASKGYSPLTDEEKYSLNDKQIEDWEKKLKEGALGKDKDLNDISNLLKERMSSFAKDGTTLYSLGISLGGYFETEKDKRGEYKIDEEKLKNAITEDPDKVVNYISSLAASVYDKLNIKMKSTSMNSVYNVYQDKQLKKDIETYEKKVKDMETKMFAIEDKYYRQFAQMEKMLASLQSQQTYMSNFFGW